MKSNEIKIAKSVLDAERFARQYFGREVEQSTFHEKRYGTTTCRCGETKCIYFVEVYTIVEKNKTLSVFAIGICEFCGEEF